MRKNLVMTAVIVAAVTTPISAEEFAPPALPFDNLNRGEAWNDFARSERLRGGYSAQAPQFSPLRQALSKYYTAKSVDEKNAAEKTIQESLSKQFDTDLKKRQADLDAIRKRVEEMEKSLLKRKANRQAIIDLRKQVLLNESEGLGWSAGEKAPRQRNLSYGFPPPPSSTPSTTAGPPQPR